MGLLSLVVVYSYSMFYILQVIFGLSDESMGLRIFTVSIFVLALVVYSRRIIKYKKICKWDLWIFVLVSAFLVSALYTRMHYGFDLPRFNSLILSFGVRAIPALVLGALIAQTNSIKELAKWIQPIMILYTISVFAVVIMNQSGYLSDYKLYGIDRQLLSYSAAFAFGMNVYLMINNTQSNNLRIFQSNKWNYLNILAVVPQIYCVLAGGGRGAFLLTLIFFAYLVIKKSRMKLRLTFPKMLIGVALIIAILSLINLIGTGVSISSGYDRILTFFTGENPLQDNNRLALWETGLNSFKENPIIGHGIGSVAYEVGFYSHNLFIDLLVEGGIVFLIIFLVLLGIFARDIHGLIRIDKTNMLVLIIFLSSFIMLQFSGSYMSDGGIWFAFAYVFMSSTIIGHSQYTRKIGKLN